ncbi:MAG: radical SAM protein [Lachnospiraceae bacterium]|nr:radical SAM protein [Lachnospiraceae bacterium]
MNISETCNVIKSDIRCNLCPRNCNVDRANGQKGYCGLSGDGIYVARAALHMWEEECISGIEGSGTVFFSGCTLRCVYCQNYEIARNMVGRQITVERLAEIFLELQEKRANNINLVTPTHYSDKIKQAVIAARKNGLRLPIVYNCSGYEKVDTLKSLREIVDIYLTDFKYMDSKLAGEYSNAPDYPNVVKEALDEMVSQIGEPMFDNRGLMKSGVIVRHLILPGHTKDSKEIVRYVHERYGEKVYISLMNQYTPLERMKQDRLLYRRITEREYKKVVDYAIEIGVKNGFVQEGETAKESFIPKFDYEGVLGDVDN